MTAFLSRAEQLANHIRARILKNEWREPFPNTREWARQLAVGRNNLCLALTILQKQGILEIKKRQGIRLKKRSKKNLSERPNRFVRLLYYGIDFPSLDASFIHWAGPLSAALEEKEGRLSIEKLSDERLRELCKRSLNRSFPNEELLLPFGMSAKYQRILVDSGRPCIHIGTPGEDIPIPYVVCDLSGAIRHATRTLLGRGFRKLTFILSKTHGPGVFKMQQAFEEACREWSGQKVEAVTLLVRLDDEEERSALNHLAGRISVPHGILIMPPLSVGLLATTLMARDIEIPSQVEIVVVASNPDAIRVRPPLTLYPFPLDLFLKTLTDAIFKFWETGKRPSIRETLPLPVL